MTMQRHGIMNAIVNRTSFGDESFSSGRIEHDPMDLSKPNLPQAPRHVGMRVKNEHIQVDATIMPKYR